MPYTQLSPTATPGNRYSFSAKEKQIVFPRGSDLFTQLSVMGLPGQRQSFLAKSAAVPDDDMLYSFIYEIEEGTLWQ